MGILESGSELRIKPGMVVVSVLIFLGHASWLGACAGRAEPQASLFYLGDSVAFHYDDETLTEAVSVATKLWSSCDQYSSGFPRFVDRGPADRLLHVELRGIAPDRRCGSFAGTRILLYRFSRSSSGSLVGCGSLGQNLAHEIGHALGLPDRSRHEKGTVSIMTRLHPLNRFSRLVHANECHQADLKWQTQAESARPPSSGSPLSVAGQGDA